MGKVVVVLLASRIHGEEYYRDLAYNIQGFFSKFEGVTVVEGVVVSLNDVEVIARKYRGYYPVIVFLTGGTSRLARYLIRDLGQDSAVFIAQGEHNSLPSAISARARLDVGGVSSWIFTCRSFRDEGCLSVLEEAVKIALTTSSIRGAKVCLVGLDGRPSEAEDFERAFKARVDVVTSAEFESLVKSVGDSVYVDRFMGALTRALSLGSGVNRNLLRGVGAIYAALRELIVGRGYDAVAINCFPYLVKHKLTPCLALAVLNSEGYVAGCEADLTATLLMMISRRLSNSSGWISNPSHVEGDKLYLAHCTAALDLLNEPRITTHFESGHPYALTGRLRDVDVTIASIDYEFTTIVAARGRILRSGMMSNAMCRVQAEVKLDFPATNLPQVALANHHVIMPGDLRKQLRILAHLLGLDYINYEELIKKAS